MKKNLQFTFLLLGCFLIQEANAQSIFQAENSRGALHYEFLRPSVDINGFLDNNNSRVEINNGLFSTAHFLNVHVRVNRSTMLVGELPIGHVKLSVDGSDEDLSETKVGNPSFQQQTPSFPNSESFQNAPHSNSSLLGGT